MATLAFDTWVKAIIGIVSFLKAIPLVLGMLALFVWTEVLDASFELDGQFNEVIIAAGLLLFSLIGLLSAQTYAVMRSRKTFFMIAGGLVCLADVFIILAHLNDAPSMGLGAFVIAGQFAAYVAAARTKF